MALDRFYTQGFEQQGANDGLVVQARHLLDAASGDYPPDPSIPPAFDFKDTINASRAEWRWYDTLLDENSNEVLDENGNKVLRTVAHERLVVNVVRGSLIIALSHRHLEIPGIPQAAVSSQTSLVLDFEGGLHGEYTNPRTEEDFQDRLDHTMAALGIRAFVPEEHYELLAS